MVELLEILEAWALWLTLTVKAGYHLMWNYSLVPFSWRDSFSPKQGRILPLRERKSSTLQLSLITPQRMVSCSCQLSHKPSLGARVEFILGVTS